jgi:hypothetical protein
MTTPGAATSLLGQVGMQQHSQQSENGAGQLTMRLRAIIISSTSRKLSGKR